MTENVTAFDVVQPISRWTAYKYRLMIAGVGSMSLAGGLASAAINFTPISELLQAVITLLPDFMDLIVGIAPLNGLCLENVKKFAL